MSDNKKQWFQIKEKSAGEKRLILTWYLYKIFGKGILYIIAVLMSFFTLIFSKEVRSYSKEYLSLIQKYTNIKPNIINQFRHINAYAVSLADRIRAYSGGFDVKDLVFESEEKKKELFDDINMKKGVFFICNHIGNIEVLQSFLINETTKKDFKTNIFLSKKQSQIFSAFIDRIKTEMPVNIFFAEEIGIDTGAKLKESLDKGDIVFIAGDRLAEENDRKCYTKELFEKKIFLPKGTYKLAKLMEVPVYFISAVKQGKKYNIYLDKQTTFKEEELTNNFVNFLEKMILKNPLQFFHFYKFFN